MSNPLFNTVVGNSPMNSLMQRFNQFRQTFQGDPKQQVQQLLNSGRVSQADYNRAYQMAQQLQQMMHGK